MSEAFGANLNPVNQEEDRKKLRRKQRDFVKALFPKGVPETIDETSKKILAKVGEFTTFAEMNLFEQRVTETFKLASKEGRTLTPTEIYQALGMPVEEKRPKSHSLNTQRFSVKNQPPPGKIRPIGDSISPI